MLYHRFVMKCGKIDPENEGILCFGTNLWKSVDDEELANLIKWFNGHLDVPRKFKIKARKNQTTGIFWFKNSDIHIQKGRELAAYLSRKGYPTVHIVSENPGEIESEDRFQVSAKFTRRVKWKIHR